MFLSREEVRAIDRRAIEEFGMPGAVLMENAGRGAAELLIRLGINGQVVICCGKGNNGGDGFVMARHLENRCVRVQVLLFAAPQTLAGDAAVNYRILERSGIPITVHADPLADLDRLRQALASGDWIVDGLFGTGLTGPVRSPLDRVIEAINAAPAKVFALDIPSGLDCDTGLPLGATVWAHHTATFVAAKKGFAGPEAQRWVGDVHVVDIGVPACLVRAYAKW
jgi:NAD(P)H-hydrate epimerase